MIDKIHLTGQESILPKQELTLPMPYSCSSKTTYYCSLKCAKDDLPALKETFNTIVGIHREHLPMTRNYMLEPIYDMIFD
jgi:hypothetical protein